MIRRTAEGRRVLELHGPPDTFLRFFGPLEWHGRLFGRGVGIRDHRKTRPYFSERNRVGPDHYLHIGPYCIVYFGKRRGHD